MRFLLLRLEAPLMAFGGPMIDAIGRTRRFPGQAQITGLLGNALGWRHADAARLDALQARLRLAAGIVRPGEPVRDYQTVDLGQKHLAGTGWTTRGTVEEREGASGDTTHIRLRWYLADACVALALTLAPPEPAPDLDALAAALARPARPLFIGRKTCLPTAPIGLGLCEAADPADALREARARMDMPDPGPVSAEIDARLLPYGATAPADTERLIDGRDWRNQMHTVERLVVRPNPDAIRP